MKGRCADGVGGDLVFYHSRADHGSHKVSCASRCSRRYYFVIFLVKLLLQKSQKFFCRSEGVALGPYIGAGENIILFVNDYALC